jgi:hypothetical protein
MFGEAVAMYGEQLINCPGHEWDNRTTVENAAWLLGRINSLQGIDRDLAIYGTAYEYDGERLDPLKMVMHVTKSDRVVRSTVPIIQAFDDSDPPSAAWIAAVNGETFHFQVYSDGKMFRRCLEDPTGEWEELCVVS